MAGLLDRCGISGPVQEALRERRPVVALESTLITHGFPFPLSREVAAGCEEEVRAAGAVPATVAIREGRILVGLDVGEMDDLANAREPMKASRSTLAAALCASGWASTTVSATMLIAHAVGIPVFATGGVGGVHRGALGGGSGGASFDISPDLTELARTPVIVVCAGPKAILDVRLTIEHLETLGVPIVTLGTEEIPGFFSRASGVRSPQVADDLEQLACMLRTAMELGLGTGALACVPIPEADELARAEVEPLIEALASEAQAKAIEGGLVTPWLLRRLGEATSGASTMANVHLLRNNARTAGRLAVELNRL